MSLCNHYVDVPKYVLMLSATLVFRTPLTSALATTPALLALLCGEHSLVLFATVIPASNEASIKSDCSSTKHDASLGLVVFTLTPFGYGSCTNWHHRLRNRRPSHCPLAEAKGLRDSHFRTRRGRIAKRPRSCVRLKSTYEPSSCLLTFHRP